MRSNRAAIAERELPRTHEGAPGPVLTAEERLRRSVMSCMLWEDEFYEDGEGIADRIRRLVCDEGVRPGVVAEIAVAARHEQNLRHVPLLLCSLLAGTASGTSLVGDTIAQVISRADELAELVAIHARVCGVHPSAVKPVLSAQMKRGLALAFPRFDAHQLAKYDRAGPVRLRDVLFLCHARPRDDEQAEVWRQLIDGRLPAPDTWEVALSGGADKRETFERLLTPDESGEIGLGYLALLRNLRNMTDAEVDRELIAAALRRRQGARRVLPFRYVAAARACPQMEPEVDEALLAALDEAPVLPGRTIVLVDVSGSMVNSRVSERSDMTRMDAACALAALVRSEHLRVMSFSNGVVEVPPRRGMALVDAIRGSQRHGGTDLGGAVRMASREPHDRLIVVTDEQSHTPVPDPSARSAWMLNVASGQCGVGSRGRWQRVDGWSDGVIRYISEVERSSAATP